MHPFNKKTILACCLAIASAGFYACVESGNSQTPQNLASAGSNTAILDKIPKLLDRAESLQYGKEWENTQNAYGKARKQLMDDPTAKEPWLNLAEIFEQEARVTGEHPHYYPAALACLDELLAKDFNLKDPKENDLKFRALSSKAGVEMSLHEFAKALETGEEAVKLNPFNAGIYGVLTDANVELGNYDKAVEMADKMVSIKPDLRSYSRVSYLREIYGDVPGAIDAMTMAAKAGYPGYDNTSWAMVTLGNLYLHYGKLPEAESVFRVALEERPNYPFAMAGLAAVETEMKNYKEAESLLLKATAIIPEVGFYEKLATVYKATGRTEDFNKTIQAVITMMQEDQAAGHNMDLEFAHVYSNLFNDQDKALEYAKKEYAVRPANIDVNSALAMIYSRKGDLSNAKIHRKKALRTGSKNPELLAMKD